ncbi:MAG: monovalent cation/H+ antiporter subunit D family protein, partial [Hyphomicrobiales bacterium]|nr:monovalent cation/H+ antiporter subunit D family protein [Hyphomicrobiales bacterium]
MNGQLPALQVVIPLLGGVLCAFLTNGRVAWGLATAISFVLPVIALTLLFQTTTDGPISYAIGDWAPPFGIEYRVDVVNAFVLVLVTGVNAVILPYAYHSVASEISARNQAWYYTMHLMCLTGLLGMAISDDAFNIFVFMEISSLASYVLIALGRDRRSLLAAYRYLIIGTIGATFYVIGVGFLFNITGTLNLVDIAEKLGAIESSSTMMVALGFLITGISLKLALFPLHVWLPNAYTFAPSVATVFLAATATKVAVYLLLRIMFSMFGIQMVVDNLAVTEVFIVLSVLAMFGGSLVACYQDNLKRMLAYSSVSQIGYITLGLALANKSGLTGGIVHLANHAMIKATLFMVMGGVFYRLATDNISGFAGLGRRMPVSMGIFVIAGLALIGVPGTAGFITKWYLVLGAMERGWWWLAFLIVASSVIAVIYRS